MRILLMFFLQAVYVILEIITLLNIQLLFCGPLEYNCWMLEKLRKETKLPTSHYYIWRVHVVEWYYDVPQVQKYSNCNEDRDTPFP